MNAQAIAQVANFLNVSPNQIKRCEEWASVLFVQIHGSRPRFVSKKVIMEIKKVENWKEHDYEVFENGVKYRVFSGFNYWYVKPATGWKTVERPDICELAEKTYRAEIAVRRQAAAQSIQPVRIEAKMMDEKEALDCWFGTGNW